MEVDHNVETYTVGLDREMDLYLAPYDVLGSLAHITMLESIGLLESDELKALSKELVNIYHEAESLSSKRALRTCILRLNCC